MRLWQLLYRTVLVASLPLALIACASSPFVPSHLQTAYSKRTTSDKILIYRNENPKLPFIEIGLVHASCKRFCSSLESSQLLKTLREGASLNGGDALMDLEVTPTGVSATVIRFVKQASAVSRR